MKSSYKDKDVTLLLKDITGLVEPLPSDKREVLIQSGVHYCEMLPLEYRPTQKYIDIYNAALKNYAMPVAKAVSIVSEKIYAKKGNNAVIVSLARAGLPIGILIKRYLLNKYKINVPHYGISIIRGKGIDDNAMKYILQRHKAKDIQFVDGWIGKGAILNQLKEALKVYPDVSPDLAVIADPAGITELCGTHDDIIIPSSCLNSTVSGLVSRTFLRNDIITNDDFHGAAYYKELSNEDVSYEFIETIEKYFDYDAKPIDLEIKALGINDVNKIKKDFGIDDINFIKPGIGEATRVLLRRVPYKLLINESDKENPMLKHLLRLAEEKNIPTQYYEMNAYKACGIIKKCSDL